MRAPQVGEIVHYWEGEKPSAAIITEVNGDGTVSLHVWRKPGHGGGADLERVKMGVADWHWSWIK